MIPTPKYEINSRVFSSSVDHVVAKHPCPDCLGSGKWTGVTPAGREFMANCPRCSLQWGRDDKLRLDYRNSIPRAEALTIGSVRIDTNDQEHPVSYMCRETGVGSGSIYYENNLFSSEKEATAHAALLANAENAEQSAKPEAVEHKYLSQLQTDKAMEEGFRSEIWKSWYRYKSLRSDIREVLADENMASDDLRTAVDEKLNFDASYRVEVGLFQALLDAAVAVQAKQPDEGLGAVLSRIPSFSGELQAQAKD